MKKIALAALIGAISLVSYYYPLHKKGYSLGIETLNLIEARNYALSGTMNYEDSKGVMVAPEKAVAQAKSTAITNPLTPLLYGFIFKQFGFHPRIPVYTAIALFSLFNVLIFLLLTRIFSLRIGFVGALLNAFMPLMTVGALYGGSYEFAMIFFVLALFAYLSKPQPSLVRLCVASILFALAALARNAFAISFIPFLVYDVYYFRSIKRALVLLVPFLLIFGSTLTPFSWLGVGNGYKAGIDQQPFSQVGHVFNDPYTLYYDREHFIQTLIQEHPDRSVVYFGSQWGYAIPLKARIKAYALSFGFYPQEAISLTNYGGQLIIGLMLIGLWQLFKTKKQLIVLFSMWVVVWLGYLVYDQTANWDHFMELMVMVDILAAVGFWFLADVIADNLHMKRSIVVGIMLILVIGHLGYASKWRLYDSYRSSRESFILKAKDTMTSPGTYAVSVNTAVAYGLAYYSQQNVIYFNPETVDRLLAEHKLAEAFSIYGVTAAVGYSSDVSSELARILKIPVTPWDKR